MLQLGQKNGAAEGHGNSLKTEARSRGRLTTKLGLLASAAALACAAVIPGPSTSPDLRSLRRPSIVYAVPPVQLRNARNVGVDGKYWFVGAADAARSDINNNTGIRSTMSVTGQHPTNGAVFASWISEPILTTGMWGQVGYYVADTGTGYKEYPFYEVWNLTSDPNGPVGGSNITRPINPGNHTFSMYFTSGTSWSFAVDGKVLGSFDLGAPRYSAGYNPIIATVEQGQSNSGPQPLRPVLFSSLMVQKKGMWKQAGSAYANYSAINANAANNTWGIQGSEQNGSFYPGEFEVGGNYRYPGSSSVQLWNSCEKLNIVAPNAQIRGLSKPNCPNLNERGYYYVVGTPVVFTLTPDPGYVNPSEYPCSKEYVMSGTYNLCSTSVGTGTGSYQITMNKNTNEDTGMQPRAVTLVPVNMYYSVTVIKDVP